MSRPLRILLIGNPIEFELATQALIRAELEIHTHRVTNKDSMFKALHEGEWDLALANHRFSGYSPEDALKLLKTAQLDIPFILISKSISKDRLTALFKAGADLHLTTDNLYLLPATIQHALETASSRRKLQNTNTTLHRSENRYRNLFYYSPVPTLILRKDRLVYTNLSARRILCLNADTPVTEIALKNILPNPPDIFSSNLTETQDSASIQPVNTTFRRLDGKQIQVEVWASRISHHGISYTQLIFFDTSTRHSTAQKLWQATDVFENTSEGAMITDKEANIIAVNPAFEMITGYTQEEALGKNPSLLKSGRHDAAFYRDFWETLNREGSWQGEIWNQRKNGEVYPEWLSITALQDAQGEPSQYIALFSDITSIKQSQLQLEHLAHHDPLTDLPNRLLFEDRLEHAITQAKRQHNHLAVLFLDLDRFKTINDSLGHAVGDALLVQVAKRLQHLLRENDTAARLGGDEFTILAENLEDPSYTAVIASKIQNQFKKPFDVFGRTLHVTASIGISLYPEDGEDVSNLTKNADAAMYQAKENGRNSYRFYTSELTQLAFDRLLMETELRTALKEQQLLLFYQPQFSLSTGKMTGIEALLRWNHPRLGLISPNQFIPLAEETGLIYEIGLWTLEEACTQTRKWSQMGLFAGRMAVNLSVRQIMQTDLILRFEEIIDQTGCPPKQLQFEVTEGIFMGQMDLSIPVLDVFKQLGVTIAIDDFGTGFSSLSYLKQLPIDKLKIDRSFIQELPDNSDDVAISQSIISLGQTLGLEIIAEGVETEAQQNLLKSMGCQEVQGYLYDKPMPAGEFEVKLNEEYRQTRQNLTSIST